MPPSASPARASATATASSSRGSRAAVTGTDRLGLDTDHDKIACGPGDAGVPPPVSGPHVHE